jgi:hypothetical protein
MVAHGDELARKDSALALGVMRAKEYAVVVSMVLMGPASRRVDHPRA